MGKIILEGLEEVLESQLGLRFFEEEEKYYLKGYYFLNVSLKGYRSVQERYHLKISLPSNFPYSIPLIRELDNKIEIKADNHTFTDTGHFCLGIPIQLKLFLRKNPNLNKFLGEYLDYYLYALTLRIQDGIPFVFGERLHGDNGIYEYFSEIFEEVSEEKIQGILRILGEFSYWRIKSLCFCGCERKLKACKKSFTKIKQLNKKYPLDPEDWKNYYSF